MSTHYGYETDDERIEALSECIALKRLEDVIPGEDYVLHASYWWIVAGELGETGALDLEIAGPSDSRNPETAVLDGDEDSLVVTASAISGLQFQGGTLLDVPWPDCDLIYVENARRGCGSSLEERVYGVFVRRYGHGGEPYYALADPERQLGAASGGFLFQGRDLILAWEPVDVAALLKEMGDKEDG